MLIPVVDGLMNGASVASGFHAYDHDSERDPIESVPTTGVVACPIRFHGPTEPGRTQNSTAENGDAPAPSVPVACAVSVNVDREPADVSSRRTVSGTADCTIAQVATVTVESYTRMSAVAFFDVSATDVAVTVAIPGEAPVTLPAPLTVATPGFDDVHDTAVDGVPVDTTLGVSVNACPML